MNAESNKLFPIFLKLEELQLLIIGGGNTALEKLNSVLSNSPQVAIRIVAKEVINEIFALQQKHFNINIVQKEYNSSDIGNANIIIVAANNKQLSAQIKDDAHQQNILVNVADTPDLCDFYLSSVVQKGNLKIAISTNGKSPTLAKRLKEIFTEVLPAEIDEVLDNLQIIRNKLKGNFADKVTTVSYTHLTLPTN